VYFLSASLEAYKLREGNSMARITVEDCLTRENNRFALVQLCSKRTRQMLRGSTARVPSKNKPIVTALREIADGVVRFMTPEETQAFEEQQALEAEAARQAEAAERERRAQMGAALFGNGADTRSADFLRESLLAVPPREKEGTEDSDEE
jgi:DNA-directed RNA polymerase subunit omega